LGHSLGEGADGYLMPLLIGTFFNGLAQFPYLKLAAIGHSRYVSVLHTIEIVPYMFLLIFLSINYGVNGAAIAWATRCGVDFISLVLLEKFYISFLGQRR